MLSYQHAYHAGNPADVLKHFVLFLVLQSLKKKETPFHFYDTHAGAGEYNLTDDESQKTGESKNGIEKLQLIAKAGEATIPEQIKLWLLKLEQIQTTANNFQLYPGSPSWALHLMREQDKATFLELHPAEYEKLRRWQGREKRVKSFKQDSFKDLKAHLPPFANRGAILIDPPYELISDYLNVSSLLKESIKRFAHGVYLIWYPIVERGQDLVMLDMISDLQIPKTLLVEMTLRKNRTGLGLSGTGMIIINCPWQVDQQINSALSWLTDSLVDNQEGSPRVEWLVKE